MYRDGLGLTVLGGFDNHQGFDGVMLGMPASPYHFEFTVCRTHPVKATPTSEDLCVFYVPDPKQWLARCEAMLSAGFKPVSSFNPYWDQRGRTFEDADGYRIVIEQSEWTAA
jgi:hypothetical protein